MIRVLVPRPIGALSSAEAGQAIAAGWASAQADSQLAVAPLGESGSGFARAIADQLEAEVELVSEPDNTALMAQVVGTDLAVLAAEPLEPVFREGSTDGSRPPSATRCELLRRPSPRRMVSIWVNHAMTRSGSSADRSTETSPGGGYGDLDGITQLDLTAARGI